MDPITAISLGAAVAGGAVAAFGSVSKGNADASMDQYKGGMALINQQIAKQNASYETKVGEVHAQIEGEKTRAELGQVKSTQGAGNLDVNSGSNKLVQESVKEVGAQNQATVRSDAARRAYGFEVEANQQGLQSGLYDKAAGNDKKAGYLGAASSLIGAAGSVSSKWLQAKDMGVFGGSGGGGYYGGSPATNSFLVPA